MLQLSSNIFIMIQRFLQSYSIQGLHSPVANATNSMQPRLRLKEARSSSQTQLLKCLALAAFACLPNRVSLLFELHNVRIYCVCA